MSDILAPRFYNGFPFPIMPGAEWDGTTFFENGTQTLALEEETEEVPLFTPAPNVTGSGTPFPLAGMALDTTKRLCSRVRSWDYAETILGIDAASVLYVGASAPDLDDGAQREEDLSSLFGISKTFEVGEGISYGIVFRMFAGGYDAFPLKTSAVPFDGDSQRALGFSLGFAHPRMVSRVVEGVPLYYPQIVHGRTDTPLSISSLRFKGGDPATAVGGGGLASLTFDPVTLVFEGSGEDYTFTVTPKKHWTYGGKYDEDTGALT